jgi:hypothetical protein
MCGFYLALARSAVCCPPSLRDPSPNCDRTKNQTKHPAADSAQVRCIRYAESLVTTRASRVASSTEARARERQLQCLCFADRAQEDDKQTGLGQTWQCPVLWIADDRSDMATSTRMAQSGRRDARIHRTIVTEYRRRGPGERANPTEQTMNVTFHALTAVQDAGLTASPF